MKINYANKIKFLLKEKFIIKDIGSTGTVTAKWVIQNKIFYNFEYNQKNLPSFC